MTHLKRWLIALVAVFAAIVTLNMQTVQADDSLAKIQQKGTIVMGTSPDYAPYEFLVNKNGKNQVVGMDVEVARKIAKDLGVKLVIKQMNFSSLLVALQSGKVDMVLAAMSPTNARRKSIDFSKTYYKSGQDILINKTDAKIYKDHKSFANKKVGVQNGSLQETLAKTQMKSSTTLGLTKVTDLILALKTHKVAGVVAEGAVAEAYTSNDDKLVEIPGHFNLS
ncbi:ABC transporter permease, partial [Lacticaseibacillus rhamnosus]